MELNRPQSEQLEAGLMLFGVFVVVGIALGIAGYVGINALQSQLVSSDQGAFANAFGQLLVVGLFLQSALIAVFLSPVVGALGAIPIVRGLSRRKAVVSGAGASFVGFFALVLIAGLLMSMALGGGGGAPQDNATNGSSSSGGPGLGQLSAVILIGGIPSALAGGAGGYIGSQLTSERPVDAGGGGGGAISAGQVAAEARDVADEHVGRREAVGFGVGAVLLAGGGAAAALTGGSSRDSPGSGNGNPQPTGTPRRTPTGDESTDPPTPTPTPTDVPTLTIEEFTGPNSVTIGATAVYEVSVSNPRAERATIERTTYYREKGGFGGDSSTAVTVPANQTVTKQFEYDVTSVHPHVFGFGEYEIETAVTPAHRTVGQSFSHPQGFDIDIGTVQLASDIQVDDGFDFTTETPQEPSPDNQYLLVDYSATTQSEGRYTSISLVATYDGETYNTVSAPISSDTITDPVDGTWIEPADLGVVDESGWAVYEIPNAADYGSISVEVHDSEGRPIVVWTPPNQ